MREAVTMIMIGMLSAPAVAGDCKIQSVNGQSVQVCDNGYVETTGRGGVRRSFGIRNGGVERYPGNSVPAWAIERRR